MEKAKPGKVPQRLSPSTNPIRPTGALCICASATGSTYRQGLFDDSSLDIDYYRKNSLIARPCDMHVVEYIPQIVLFDRSSDQIQFQCHKQILSRSHFPSFGFLRFGNCIHDKLTISFLFSRILGVVPGRIPVSCQTNSLSCLLSTIQNRRAKCRKHESQLQKSTYSMLDVVKLTSSS